MTNKPPFKITEEMLARMTPLLTVKSFIVKVRGDTLKRLEAYQQRLISEFKATGADDLINITMEEVIQRAIERGLDDAETDYGLTADMATGDLIPTPAEHPRKFHVYKRGDTVRIGGNVPGEARGDYEVADVIPIELGDDGLPFIYNLTLMKKED